MARRKTDIENYAETQDETPEISEKTEQIEEKEDKSMITEMDWNISNDPFLTDEQKDVLFNYEFKKRVTQIQVMRPPAPFEGPITGKATLFQLKNGTSWVILANGAGIKIAWEYYKAHIRGGTPENFLARLKEALGQDKVRTIPIEIMVAEP